MMTPHEYQGYELVGAEDLKIKHRATRSGGIVYIDAPCGKKYKLMPRDVAVLADQLTSHAAAVMPPEPKAGWDSVNFSVNIPDAGFWNNKPELSLLVIDLGDSCVLKVEKGVMPEQFGDNTVLNQCLMHSSFEDIKKSIDGHYYFDQPKPQPRIERDHGDYADCPAYQIYYLYDGQEVSYRLPANPARELKEILGHDLPIFKTKAGTWTQLNGMDWSNAKQAVGEYAESQRMVMGIDTHSFEKSMFPFTAWRYTR